MKKLGHIVFLLLIVLVTVSVCTLSFSTSPARHLRDGRVMYVLPPNVTDGDARRAMTTVRMALAGLQKEFPGVTNAPLRVSLTAATGDFTVRTGQPPWVGADYNAGEITLQPISLLVKLGTLDQTVRHEAAHHALYVTAGDRIPLWLAEGFCTMFETSGKDSESGDFRSLTELNKALTQRSRSKQAEKAYVAAARFVEWLDRRNDQRVARVVRNTGKSNSFEAVFRKEFGLSPEMQFRKWNSSTKRKSKTKPK